MAKKEKNPLNNTFFGSFMGSYVQLAGTYADGELLSIKGYMLDADEEFFYLGPDLEGVTMCVAKRTIDIVSLDGELPEIHDMLKKIDVPKSESEIN